MEDIQKTLIRIIQDYCFENMLTFECDKLATYLSDSIVQLLTYNNFNLSELKKSAVKRKTFFVGNNITIDKFCKGLFKKLKYELQFHQNRTLLDELIIFKQKMEDGNFRGFPKEQTSEDTLRCTLNLYLDEETFCEPRSAGGNCDIAVAKEESIIETKLWKGSEYYKSGIPELAEYVHKKNYKRGYYVIFDYNISDNEVIQNSGEIFNLTYENIDMTVIFVRLNPIRPSKKYKHIKNSNVSSLKT